MNQHSRALLCALFLGPCAHVHAQAQSPRPAQLPPIVITGRHMPDPAQQELQAEQAMTPGGVTLVDGEGLRLRNASNMTDMLRYVPGVWSTSSGGDQVFISARGSNLDATNYDGNGIKLMQDGLPVTAADGSNHNRVIDPLAARYAVVARGANALTYGASTLGGAIDFITPKERDGAPNELLLNTGSHDQLQGRLTLGTVAGAFDGLITIEGKRGDGYREHQKQERKGLYANAGWELSDAVRTRFYATAIDNDQQLPGSLTRDQWRADPHQAEAAAVAGNYRLNVKTWRLANKTNWDVDAQSRFTVGLSYEEQRLFHPIVFAPPFFSLLVDTDQHTLGSTLRYERHIGTHDLLVGLNYGRTTNKGNNFLYHLDPDVVLNPVDEKADSLELFVMDRWQFAPDWTAVVGGQAVRGSRKIRNDNLDGDFDSINPRVGLIYQLAPTAQLFANVSRAYEAPTLFELRDESPGSAPTALLDAMHGTVVELGTRGTHDAQRSRWHWDVTAYYGWLRDEILSRDDPLAPGTSLSTNVDRTIHAGIEALLGASFALDGAGAHRIEPLVSLTLNHFKFDDDAVYGNNRLPAAPRYAIKGELLYRNASGFFAGPTFDVVGRRWADFENTYKIRGYTLWGLRAGFAGKQWELYAEGRNLTDKDHISAISVRDVAAAGDAILSPGEPRSVFVGARVKF